MSGQTNDYLLDDCNHTHTHANKYNIANINDAQDRQCNSHTQYTTHTYASTQNNTYIVKDYNIIKPIIALDMLNSQGTTEENIQNVNTYADSVNMNQVNRDLLLTLKTEGPSAMIKKAFEDPSNPSRQLSYSEMRAIYG